MSYAIDIFTTIVSLVGLFYYDFKFSCSPFVAYLKLLLWILRFLSEYYEQIGFCYCGLYYYCYFTQPFFLLEDIVRFSETYYPLVGFSIIGVSVIYIQNPGLLVALLTIAIYSRHKYNPECRSDNPKKGFAKKIRIWFVFSVFLFIYNKFFL